MEKKSKRRKFFKRLRSRYRLLIINETDLQEKASVWLTPFNVILLFCGSFVIFFLFVYGLIAFIPPLREYIPGYGSTLDKKMKREIIAKMEMYDKTLAASRKREQMLVQILTGEIPDSKNKITESNTSHYVKEQPIITNQTAIDEDESSAYDYLFFTPLRGKVTQKFDASLHPAIDIAPDKDISVKAIKEGTVVFSGWTPDFGYVLAIQHNNSWMSVYKHNSVLHKKTGSFVEAGETIATAGNSGELSSGIHLHFELWHDGVAMDPTKYIYF